MATVTYIKEAKQHISAMKAVIRYCQREDKTTDPKSGRRYVTGLNCSGTNAFTEFLATKTAYNKLDGINFYQYVQSFSPREKVIVLRKGECQRKNGTYHYSWTDAGGKRHFVYAPTLEELREKEAAIGRDQMDGIKAEARYVTLNELFDLWCQLKRGLKNNTFENYKYMYNTFVKPNFGKQRVTALKKSDVKRFYNHLADERGLQASTIDGVHTVLHQVLDMAVDDNYIRSNPSGGVLKELKQSHVFKTEKRRGLTKPEQDLLLDFLRKHPVYNHWYPIFAVMVGTGLRVGELAGLRWCDIDLEEGIIDVNHTLVYYDHRDPASKQGCYFNVHTPKTEAGKRQVPMLEFVKEAFIMEQEYQRFTWQACKVTIDGYTDFIFVNRDGGTFYQGSLNKTIRRIIRDCNDAVLQKGEENPVLLPHFSCHSLRHTFTTRMCEAGVNIKVMQDTLGHADISTTLNIYADVTRELKKDEFAGLDSYFKGEEKATQKQGEKKAKTGKRRAQTGITGQQK